MHITDERIASIAKQITETLTSGGSLAVDDPNQARKLAQVAMVKYVQSESALDEKVRAKIMSIKRGVLEGSSEWDILYNKYYEEELNRMG